MTFAGGVVNPPVSFADSPLYTRGPLSSLNSNLSTCCVRSKYFFQKHTRRGAPPGIGYDYRSSSGTKSNVMDLRSVFSWVNFTPADSIIRLEARVDMESAYLSER